jgi:4-amino-4-deoxy-L-arabinose transferase-like glycosyltransferase
MFQRLDHRLGHYVLLLAVAVLLYFPNLGKPSLWDIDEGNNAEAAREMRDAGNWIVPTFNFQLRVDKPALLYWLQIAAYESFGVNEFAARLPSALAALLTVLLAYELGRRMFDPLTGLLGGLVLATAVMFTAAAHFANPDALLNACTVLTFLFVWHGIDAGGRNWLIWTGVSSGFAVLAKGPVGLVLPSAVTMFFLLWTRQWRRLLDVRLLVGVLAFLVVIAPWYAWVGVETKAEFLRGFFLQHNVGRFLSTMENHGGPPVLYYLLVLIVGFTPWSPFLGLALWYGIWPAIREPWTRFRGWWRHAVAGESVTIEENDQGQRTRAAYRLLWCWVAVYFLFFSISQTKLPNYILPLATPIALLLGRFLQRWRSGQIQLPAWAAHANFAGLAVTGVCVIFGLLLAGGALTLPIKGQRLPGLEVCAILGVIPLLAAAIAWWLNQRRLLGRFVTVLALAAVLFTGAVAAWCPEQIDTYKGPRALVEQCGLLQPDREIRVASYQYFQPSLVFYCRREVKRLEKECEALDFLETPLPVYLFVPAPVWEQLQAKVDGPVRVLGVHRDLLRNCDVVVVTNQ